LFNVELFADQHDTTGEGPLWSASEGALYWVDIGKKSLYRKTLTGRIESWSLPDHPGCLGEMGEGWIAIAFGNGIHRLHLASGATEVMWTAPMKRPHTRFNDGKVDPKGRFWASTMQNNFDPSGQPQAIERWDGSLFRFGADGKATTIVEDLGCGNTLAWSPDHKRFYFADSLVGNIFVYDYDLDSGDVRNRRSFFTIADCGLPDGSAMDQDGCLWNVRCNAGMVLRITPEGKVDRKISLPVPRPTSCAFGGPNLDTLFVTSARGLLDAEALAKSPHSGSVFAISGVGKGVAVSPLNWKRPAKAVNQLEATP
jgi:sugar lactone lactonase YvrE